MKMKAILSNGGADVKPVMCPINRDYCRVQSGRLDRKCMYFGVIVVDKGATYYNGASFDINCEVSIDTKSKDEIAE